MEAFANPIDPEFACFTAESTAQDLSQAECLAIWHALFDGRRRIAECVTIASRAVIVLCVGERTPSISPRGLRLLEGTLLGASAKSLAVDLSVSLSTVTTSLKETFEQLGMHCRPAMSPLGLAMLARAAFGRASFKVTCVEGRLASGEPCFILSAELARLDHLLPPAVLDVVRLQARGCSHAEIAQRRHVSKRTVANQLAHAFRCLGVSGRMGLLEYCLTAQSAQPARAHGRNPPK